MKAMNRRGFTLVELVIVLAISALLLASSVSAVSARLASGEVTAADAFRTAHALARATAVHQGRIAELHIDPEASRFWVAVRDESGSGALVKEFYVPEAVRLTSDRSLVCFDARGLAVTGSGCEPGNLVATFSLGSDLSDTVRTTLVGGIMK